MHQGQVLAEAPAEIAANEQLLYLGRLYGVKN